MSSPSGRLYFELLGPLRARSGETALDLGRPQQRALLAQLLLADGKTVSDAALIDGLWDAAPPVRAVDSLRILVSRLRSVLEPEGPPWKTLVTEAGGYALALAPGSTDLAAFERLTLTAAADRCAGDRTRARARLAEALALWDGEPLQGLPGPAAAAARAGLHEQRLLACEQRFELELELGAAAETVAELAALADAHPLRERLRALLMRALYQTGRQAEALAVWDETRRHLVDQLGLDPGPELTALHRSILAADPGLGPSARPEPAPAAERPVPAQLPADLEDFVGRDELVDDLASALRARSPLALVVTAVSGIGGIGKTSLAVRVAHRVREAFPDGQLYVDLHGAGTAPADPGAVLAGFIRALGGSPGGMPDTTEERAAVFRTLASDRRLLVVLDNAADEVQLRPLLPGAPTCGVIVTARSRLAGVGGGRTVNLEALSVREALALLGRIAGVARVSAEPEAAEQVVEACARLPLAVRIAGSRLRSRPGWTVADLAARLADEGSRIGDEDRALEATFALGYDQLDADAARAFRLLAEPECEHLTAASAAAVLRVPRARAADLCEALVDANLLETPAFDRYRHHDLLRRYARARPDAERPEVPRRLLDWYLAGAKRARRLADPEDAAVDRLHPTEAAGPALAGDADGGAWIAAEAPNLLRAVREHRGEPIAPDLLHLLRHHFRAHIGPCSTPIVLDLAERVAEAAAVRGDDRGEAMARMVTGSVAVHERRMGRARPAALAALELARRAGDDAILAEALATLGEIALLHGEHDAALAHLDTAVDRYRRLGDGQGERRALSVRSRCQAALGQGAEALRTARRGVALARDCGRVAALVPALTDLGAILTALGRHGEAAAAFGEALEAAAAAGADVLTETRIMLSLAEARLDDGDPEGAYADAERVLELRGGADCTWSTGKAFAIVGRAMTASGRPERAEAGLRQALAVFEALDAAEAAEVRDLIAALPR